ncbi:zinc ion binding protein, partial [Hortaea werneckii]
MPGRDPNLRFLDCWPHRQCPAVSARFAPMPIIAITTHRPGTSSGLTNNKAMIFHTNAESRNFYLFSLKPRTVRFHSQPFKQTRTGTRNGLLLTVGEINIGQRGVDCMARDRTRHMMIPQHTSRNRGRTKGGPSGVQRSYASQLKETEALFNSYEHLQGLPRGDAALTMLRKVASLVKPIMRKRGWKVQILAEFLPPEQNLLGLNINKGYKICIRLRYHNNPDLFLPTEQVVDTMLHELSHNVWGDHDSNFHRLWDELRDEQETLMRKGYTGEGFLSEGHRLGGGRYGAPPPHEVRRLARASAEKRQAQGRLSKGSGQRLGGTPLHLYGDVRSIIADQVTQRNTINRGCASGRGDASKLAEQQGRTTFRTKAEEDDANDRAIAQALYELMEQEEERKLKGTFSAAPADEQSRTRRPSERRGTNAMGAPSQHQAITTLYPLSPQNIDRTISAPPPPHHPPSSRPDPSRTQHDQTPPAEKISTKRPRISQA